MAVILEKVELAENIKEIVVDAPIIAKKAEPGQFVIVVVDERGERIPLTIADYDRKAGTITIVFLEIGKTTMKLGRLGVGDEMAHIAGPLGNPSEIPENETIVFVGGGVGIAAVYPIARKAKQAGNEVISIIGARSKNLLIWEDRMRAVSDELIVTTDDGSYGRKGVVTEPLKEILENGRKVDRVVTVGPAIMMKFVALTTKPYGVKTIASLNPIMVDGSGMCGACRVEVGGETKFACVDGPEFDAHQVDFDLLIKRLGTYREEEELAKRLFLEEIGGCGECRSHS
ncbi:sulfide/dihydroorotate dehydrogenase-like FAD/NAD-binding protein [Archaeoglobus veneficus]|uniref:Oxidoreductase FAD/NAD(P)-binding domain protein n=1 Tax=Archaeoglobus veneficus (strain DSM 11195 / SNP6) TaxID=693661 RepID=F2KRX4_ARCVS|nr:sulfide/dihydroorotate dehydrogenase-like FAD/NAD-binding protein [Archaeoglobus veneficus]AEA46815.1 oxidoreductase FAD/NAD(P)-binding domain protein [Archaeoglobus veneficus SNP6]